jgi:hypothetical protein
MTKNRTASSPSAASPPKKQKSSMPSPPKKKKASVPSPKKQSRGPDKIKIFAAAGLSSEIVQCTNATDTKDMFLNTGKGKVAGTITDKPHEEFDNLNITEFAPRRKAFSDNEVLRDSNGYMRFNLILYPPGGESTPETRAAALEALKSFFMDPRMSLYPPTEIETVDITDLEEGNPLDMYLQDEKIKQLILEDIPEEELNNSFKDKYPKFASSLWRGPNVSDWAKTLRF